jgi:hypothetical protein
MYKIEILYQQGKNISLNKTMFVYANSVNHARNIGLKYIRKNKTKTAGWFCVVNKV